MALDFLSGTRVVDLSQYVPGPYASLLLADQGAEVLKIERPGGEPMRSGFGPEGSDGVSPFYKVLNGGKTIVEMNLKNPDDRECFLALLAHSDVLLESFRPGVMERLGFSPDTLRSRFPSLVVCSLSGYGQTGPYRLRAGHDINYLALAGVLAGTGSVDFPAVPAPPVSDYAGGMQAVIAILGALLGRTKSGKGAYLDVSLSEAVLGWQAHALTNESYDAYSMLRGIGNETGGSAVYRVYATFDGRFIALGAQEPKFWENFCNAVDRPDWISRAEEPIPQGALIAEVCALFASRTLSHWRSLLEDCDCCFEAVWEAHELARHPQIVARQMVAAEQWTDSVTQVLYPAWTNGQPPPRRAEAVHEQAEVVRVKWQGHAS